MHAEHQHANALHALEDFAHRVQPRTARHRYVEHHHVREEAGRARHRLNAALGLTDHREPGAVAEHVANPFAHHGMIVHHQHTNRRRVTHPRPPSQTGIRITITAPAPGDDFTRTSPPSAVMRSRIPARPRWPSASRRVSEPSPPNPGPRSATRNTTSPLEDVISTCAGASPAWRATFES